MFITRKYFKIRKIRRIGRRISMSAKISKLLRAFVSSISKKKWIIKKLAIENEI
jgi:hypothetical protein